MKETSILFSTPMVRAIYDGRKTQTRRVVILPRWARRDGLTFGNFDEPCSPAPGYGPEFETGDWGPCPRAFGCPHGAVGDRLWVKEATWLWCERRPNGTTKTGRRKWHYVWQENTPPVCVADHPERPVDDIPVTNRTGNRLMWKYKTARFMPKKASRITLEITDVRGHRLQEISESDAAAEGVPRFVAGTGKCSWMAYGDAFNPRTTARAAFLDLWDSINAKRGFGWDINPWVWALTFRRLA